MPLEEVAEVAAEPKAGTVGVALLALDFSAVAAALTVDSFSGMGEDTAEDAGFDEVSEAGSEACIESEDGTVLTEGAFSTEVCSALSPGEGKVINIDKAVSETAWQPRK